MSRIGKNPIDIPNGVEINIDDTKIAAKGKLGELSFILTHDVKVTHENNQILVRPINESLRSRKMWGTTYAQIIGLIQGVSEGFTKKLQINGVGFRAQIKGGNLVLALGYSHDVIYPIANDLKIRCPDQTHIEVNGTSKQRVGQAAAEIRAFRPPEPYKGKGIKYADEFILRKEGKKK